MGHPPLTEPRSPKSPTSCGIVSRGGSIGGEVRFTMDYFLGGGSPPVSLGTLSIDQSVCGSLKPFSSM